jgi:predicted secreted protein
MSTQFVGRDVIVNFAIGVESDDPSGLTFKRLGMMRTKSMKTTWDTVDTTADMSPDYTKTNLVTFKMVEFTGDGVSYGEDEANQKEFKAHVISPGAGTNNQPKVWLQLIDPDGDQYEGPFIVTEWSDERPYADAATWSTAAMSNGAVTFTVGT